MSTAAPQPSVIQRLEVATGEGIGAFLEADGPALEAAFDGWSDDALNKFVTDLANGLPSGGIKSAEWGPFKNALIASEPSFDATANGKIADAVNALETALAHIAT
jgi:hypothetical protein